MEVVDDSAEHHFLTLLEKIKQNAGAWAGIHCAYSRGIGHDALIGDLSSIGMRLAALDKESVALSTELQQLGAGFKTAILYKFPDSDLLLLAAIDGDAEKDAFYKIFKDLSDRLKPGLVDYINCSSGIIGVQKLADSKILSAKRMKAYSAMGDRNTVSSIGVRRQRRDRAQILIVEDDRFTATYTTGILSKTYDVVHSKSGEEAVMAYIEHAPDIVFLDIHLPGLNGLETLHSLRKIDPEAYIVIVSVDTVKANIVTATARGAAGFLKKPFSRERLLAVVEKSPFIRGSKAEIRS